MHEATTQCDACLAAIPIADARTDSDGFTGCRPCFPVFNCPGYGDVFMRGPCHMREGQDDA